MSVTFHAAVAARPRAFVGVRGPDAASLLQRILSNDVSALGPGDACDALLLTNKARLIAPVRVSRRADDDFLLLTEPELGDVVERQLVRFRLAAKASVEREQHESFVLLGSDPPEGALAIATRDYGVDAFEVLDVAAPEGAHTLPPDSLERLRIEERTPAWGRELDDRVLPAEAGLVERAVSLTKGCFPGQEPIARLHYRGHANRTLRLLAIEGDEPPAYDAPVVQGEKSVGRVTSAVPLEQGAVLALAYVRREVADDAELAIDGRRARLR